MRKIKRCIECNSMPIILISGDRKVGYQYKCFCSRANLHNPEADWDDSPQKAILRWNRKQMDLRKNRKDINLSV